MLLRKIKILNFYLIDAAEINFTEGLNVIIGQSGSGKTLLLDAISVVLAKKKVAVKAYISLNFHYLDTEFCLVYDNKKYFLDNKPVSFQDLQAMPMLKTCFIVEQNLGQFFIKNPLTWLNELARIDEAELQASFKQYASLKSRLTTLEQQLARLGHQKIDILKKLSPQEGEYAQLLEDFTLAKSQVEIVANLQKIMQQLNNVHVDVGDLTKFTANPKLFALLSNIEEHLTCVTDHKSGLAYLLEDYEEQLVGLQSIKQRIDAYERTAMQAQVAPEELFELYSYCENSSELERMREELKRATQEMYIFMHKISQQRKQAFANCDLQPLLKHLSLADLELELEFEQQIATSQGVDSCTFNFNRKRLSGGELQRVVLALVLSLPQQGCLLLDELDMGTSGSLSLNIGKLLIQQNAKQILYITHSPQILACTRSMVKATKQGGKTILSNEPIQDLAREVAYLLSSHELSLTSAQIAARDLIDLAHS